MRSWTEQVLTTAKQAYEYDVLGFIALPEGIEMEGVYLALYWEIQFVRGVTLLLKRLYREKK